MENVHFESLYPPNTRFSEIKQLMEFIKAGNSCQIVGLPGVGRSNLLRLLSYNRDVRLKHFGENQKWFHFVTTDFSEIRRRPLVNAIKFLFLSLADSLRDRKMTEYEKVNQILKESLIYPSNNETMKQLNNDELVLFQGLKKAVDFLAIEKELTIVFLFDRFEEYVPMLTTDFFSNLRILRNRAKYRFSVVFSLNRPLEELLESSLFADFYEFLAGNTIYLSLYDKVGTDFRISYLEKITGKRIEKKVLDEILELTAGHGKLTRLVLEAILGLNKESGIRNKAELGDFLLKQKTILGSLTEIWQGLTPSEQKFFLQIYDLRFKNYEENFTYLELAGLVKEKRITIPLFETFIIEQSRLRQGFGEAKETIVFDENINQIKRGETVLSDQLTSSEFKLLKFLINNPDSIVDREEIISAVWKDSAATAGVTDQAIDQLIFRLRKKIESDPNNPQHIRTVKGRGVRFIP